jgi:hypothetical protein
MRTYGVGSLEQVYLKAVGRTPVETGEHEVVA